MTVSSATHSSDNNGSAPSPLAQAITRLNGSWFPANPELTTELSSKITTGMLTDTNTIIGELKRDFALYSYCLRSLIEARQQHAPSDTTPRNPAKLIREATLTELRSVLSVAPEHISDHRICDVTPDKAKRIQLAMMSAAATEELCANEGIDADLGFASALFRQLGRVLVSWNYPHIYQKALYCTKPGTSLDRSIAKFLGYSPVALGIAMARRWNLSPVVLRSMGDKSELRECDREHEEVAERITRLCEVGETLARAAQADEYPQSHASWCDAQGVLEQEFGSSMYTILRERMLHACEAYYSYAPHLFAAPSTSSQPIASTISAHAQSLLSRNTYLNACPNRLRSKIEHIYTQLHSDTVNAELVRELAQEVIPFAGFPRGCIYTLEIDAMELVPALAIGVSKIQQFDAIDPRQHNIAARPITAAFMAQAPLVELNNSSERSRPPFISGCLGSTQKAGVLYVEVARALLEQEGVNLLPRFKAVRQTLCDCLNLY